MLETITFSAAKAAGLKRYYTGKPCLRGHISERAVSGQSCLECKRIKSASPESRDNRREYMREHMRRWRAENLSKAQSTSRESYNAGVTLDRLSERFGLQRDALWSGREAPSLNTSAIA